MTQFLQAGCPSCHPTNSIKALKADIRPYMAKSNKSTQVGEQTIFVDATCPPTIPVAITHLF